MPPDQASGGTVLSCSPPRARDPCPSLVAVKLVPHFTAAGVQDRGARFGSQGPSLPVVAAVQDRGTLGSRVLGPCWLLRGRSGVLGGGLGLGGRAQAGGGLDQLVRELALLGEQPGEE